MVNNDAQIMRFIKTAVRESRVFFFNKRMCSFFIVWLFYLYICMNPVRRLSASINYPASPWGILFAFSGLYFDMVFLAGAIYMYAAVPFMERWQMYQFIRLGRQKWIGVQIFKIFAASMLYTLTVLASGVLIMIPHLEWTTDWGKLYHTLALTNLQYEANLEFDVSYNLIGRYEPVWLMLISALVFFMIISLMGLIMFLVAMRFSRMAALITTTSLAVAQIITENAGRRLQRIMVNIIPTEWIKISKAGTENIFGTRSPDFGDIILRLIIMILILTALICLSGSRVPYDWYGEE